MKLKYIIFGWLLPLYILSGCVDPDNLSITGNSNVSTLTVKGRCVSDESTEYSSTIDSINHTIVVDVPYYISDTEEVQADLTQMKLSATMPVGAKFEPSLAGIYDLSTGISRNLIYEDGTVTPYKITAAYVKSSAAKVLSATLTDYSRATVSIVDPSGSTPGEIIIYKTTSALDPILENARLTLTLSPWATSDLPEYLDLTSSKTITVTAQDGTTQQYVVSITTPSTVISGQIGYISALFGFQPTGNNPLGFVQGENRTLAVVGDYLIMGSTSKNFVVYNRYTGAKLDKTVNTTGLMDSNVFQAITSDDNGVLIAVTFAAANNSYVSNHTFEIYAWKNGIENAPTKIYSTDILTNPTFSSYASSAFDIGRTVAIKGSIVSGTAQILTVSPGLYRVVRFKVSNGSVDGYPELISIGGTVSMSTESKAIPLTTDDNTPFILGSGNYHRWTTYVYSDRTSLTFTPRSDWWGSDTKGVGYIQFNGVNIVGVQNGLWTSAGADAYNRLCIENINSMTSTAFTDAQIADFRLKNYDSNVTTSGNSTATGMTSYYASSANGGSIGPNSNKTGDVCFGKSADGNAVQVYMLTTDHGILAYELTKFDISK